MMYFMRSGEVAVDHCSNERRQVGEQCFSSCSEATGSICVKQSIHIDWSHETLNWKKRICSYAIEDTIHFLFYWTVLLLLTVHWVHGNRMLPVVIVGGYWYPERRTEFFWKILTCFISKPLVKDSEGLVTSSEGFEIMQDTNIIGRSLICDIN